MKLAQRQDTQAGNYRIQGLEAVELGQMTESSPQRLWGSLKFMDTEGRVDRVRVAL